MLLKSWACIAAISTLWTAPVAAQGATPPTTPEFPAVMIAETRNLEFHVSRPTRGTLDAQVRAAIRELTARSRGGAFVKLRVFAMGAGALDSAQRAIARVLAASHTPLPVLSLVGVVGFPDSGQRVEIEATVVGRAASNPNGLGFIAGVASADGHRSIAGLERVTREAGIPAASVLRISCFYEREDQVAAARAAIASTFPAAEAAFVFSFAASARPAIECEAMARLTAAPAHPVEYFNLPGAAPSPFYAHATLVATPRVVFASSQVAAAATTSAVHDMFERTQMAVTSVGGRLINVVMGDNYWLTDAGRDTVRLVRNQYFGGTVPAATGVYFASLPVAGARAAIELVVAMPLVVHGSAIPFPGPEMIDDRALQPHLVEVAATRGSAPGT